MKTKKWYICLCMGLLALLTVSLLTACNNPTPGPEPATETDTPAPETVAETDPPASETLPDTETEPAETEPETLPPFEATALPNSVNVAREGYAIASSSVFDGGYSNLYLNDGDLTRGFNTARGQGSNPAKEHYIMIDLAARRKVDAVKLHPLAGDEAGFPIDFDIMVSVDNKTYTKVASVDGASADKAKDGLTVTFDPVEAKYVKLVTRKTGVGEGTKGAYVALSEFEVYAAADTSENMVLNRHDIWLFKDPDITQKLEILYYRDGTAVDPNQKLTYSSADPAIATVDENGVITPVSVGETDIYVRDGVNRATCHVEVKVEPALDYRITAFYHSNFGTPDTYVTGLQILKDAGIEYIEDTRFRDRVGNNITMYMIYLCDQMGLAYSVCDQEGGEGGFLEMTDEEIIAIVQKYENRAGLFGIYLRDEPHEEYTQYAEVHRLIQEYNPHITPHLNLLPPYNFGGTEEHYTEYAAVAGGARRMQFLSFDHYPFLWNNGFNAQIYESINMVRTAGLTYNADTGYYMQSMIIRDSYPLLYERELRYNASLGMAYGMKNFKWFVALTPLGSGEAFETGLVGPDFKPADNHADITATNVYVKNLGRYLGDSDAIEVYHTSNDYGAIMLPETFLIQPVGSQTAIYSLYRANDGEGRQHILVTNKTFRTTSDATFKIKLIKDIGAISLYDPLTDKTTAIAVAADGTFSITLKPGAAALILLPEGTDAAAPAVESDNLALNKAVYCSSSAAKFWEDGNIGTHFITDGDRDNGYWMTDNKDKDAYLLLDLGKAETVSKLHLYAQTDLTLRRFCGKFTVSVSEDGITFTDVATVTDGKPADVNSPYVCEFDAVSARYIRIKLNTPRAGYGYGEIEVYA